MNLFRTKRYELPNHAERDARTVWSLLAPLIKVYNLAISLLEFGRVHSVSHSNFGNRVILGAGILYQ